jgi:hypothetical protein
VARNAVPLILTLLWRVPLSPPTPQYAGVALTQGRNPQAFPTPGGFTFPFAGRAFGRPRAGLEGKEFESQIGCEGGANEPGSNQSQFSNRPRCHVWCLPRRVEQPTHEAFWRCRLWHQRETSRPPPRTTAPSSELTRTIKLLASISKTKGRLFY